MRTLITRFNHETNTFSPVPTPLVSFHPHYGTSACHAAKGMRMAVGAFIDLAEAAGAEIVVPVVTGANPNGHVAVEAYTTLHDAIVAAAPGYDALLLDLHGVMVAGNSDDGEGDLLERLRAVVSDVPIAVALDLHGNLTQKFVDLADIAVSFRTYSYVDIYGTGGHADRLLFDKLAGRANPVSAWRRLSMITHTLHSHTDEDTMHHVAALAKQTETDGMLAMSILAGFGLTDIAAPCLSVVVVGNDDKHAAGAAVQRIADAIWGDRKGFVYRSEPSIESIARAAKLADAPGSGPMLLLDHDDNCMSGGTCDDMHALHEVLQQGLSGIAVGLVCDPEATAATIEAGEGTTVTLPVGDKMPLVQSGIYSVLCALAGEVVAISDGEYTIMGPTYTGQRIRMGRAALFDIGAAQIVITETPQEHWDLDIFAHIDVGPHAVRLALLKSYIHCRPVFVPIVKAVVEYDGNGVTSSDYTRFPSVKVQRSVFSPDVDAVPA